jgi:hypothetical protein
MNKEFIPYEQALELKELGFNEPCFTTYDDDKRLRNPFDYPKSEYDEDASYIEDSNEFIYNDKLCLENFEGNPKHFTQFVAAPIYQQAFRWFREKYNLHAEPYTVDMGAIEYCFQIRDLHSEKYVYDNFVGGGAYYDGTFNTPEESELACLNKLIEIVKAK